MAKSAPKVACSVRSGYPCDRVVSLYSPHCGDPSHFPGAIGGGQLTNRSAGSDAPDLDVLTFDPMRVQVAPAALRAWGREPAALQIQIRDALIRGGYWHSADGTHILEVGGHQMVLSADGRRCEKYTAIPQPPPRVWGKPIDLVAPEWDRQAVVIDSCVVRAFGGRHRVDDETARQELAGLLADAADSGTRRRTADGSHRLEYRGFTVVISPDGTSLTRYETIHFERTPSQVRDKVPSRVGYARKRGSASKDRSPESLDQALQNPPRRSRVPTARIATTFDPATARITGTVVPHDLPNRDLVVAGVRNALRRAIRTGTWVAGTAGRHNLNHGNRRWIVSADGKGVLSTRPAWPVRTPAGSASTGRRRGKTAQNRRQQGPPCDLCGRPSEGPICAECDYRLRARDKRPRAGRDRLYSVRSVVYGGLPTLGKRR